MYVLIHLKKSWKTNAEELFRLTIEMWELSATLTESYIGGKNYPKGFYWDKWQNWSMYCRLGNRTLSMFNFLKVITILWFCKINKWIKEKERKKILILKCTTEILKELKGTILFDCNLWYIWVFLIFQKWSQNHSAIVPLILQGNGWYHRLLLNSPRGGNDAHRMMKLVAKC